jgi:EAL domain-containing protein (putative c-di-GMP-specific phosphodiesterase class I)
LEGFGEVKQDSIEADMNFSALFLIILLVMMIVCLGLALKRNRRQMDRFLVLIGSEKTKSVKSETGKNEKFRTPKAANLAVLQQELIVKYLSQALANRELYLHYQPQYNNRLGKIEGFEALLRWKNPLLGEVCPASFVKIAETTGAIVPIGDWVLETACRFIKQVHEQGFTDCRIAVNVSAIQLQQKEFVPRVQTILKKVGLAARFLELELTESALVKSFDLMNFKLKLLRALGVQIAIDDFGIGYSSLSYLIQLKVDTLKIDKSFIEALTLIKESAILLKHIIAMGRQLGLQVIVEGVEDQTQVDFLAETDCYLVQGYFYSKPVAAETAMKMLASPVFVKES